MHYGSNQRPINLQSSSSSCVLRRRAAASSSILFTMSSDVGESPCSLFEGMVLFSPSSSSPLQNEPSASTPSPSSPSAHSTSAPLDEDFFSNLSLQTPFESSKSCNISRKKKRSFRIGYAREPTSTSEDVEAASEIVDGDTLEIIEERLNLVRSAISTKHEGVRKTATLAYSERKELEGRRRKAEQDVNKASMMYKELEQELEVACEAEDFERAEKVSECLAAAEEERDRLMNGLREMEIGCDCFDLRMEDVLSLQIAAEEEGVELLEKFAKV